MRRPVAVTSVWALATAGALVVARRTYVGRVVYSFDDRHGIHLGDLAAFLVAYAWAAVITIALVGEPPQGGRRGRRPPTPGP